MLEAVADEDPRAVEQTGERVSLALDRTERLAQLVEVEQNRLHVEVFLGAEVAVDQRLVDPDRAGDVVDLGVAHAALVEEVLGGGGDRLLALAPGYPGTAHGGEA